MNKTKSLKKIIIICLVVVILGIIGYIYWATEKDTRDITQEPHVLLPPSLMIADDVIESELNISKWKTYRNEEYGFEIKYPTDWRERFQDDNYNQDTLVFAMQSPDGKFWPGLIDISVHALELSSFQALDEKHERQILESGYNFILNKKRLMINNYYAYTMTIGGNGAYFNIYFKKNGKLYNIIFWRDATLDALDHTDRAILSTFKFID